MLRSCSHSARFPYIGEPAVSYARCTEPLLYVADSLSLSAAGTVPSANLLAGAKQYRVRPEAQPVDEAEAQQRLDEVEPPMTCASSWRSLRDETLWAMGSASRRAWARQMIELRAKGWSLRRDGTISLGAVS